MFSFLYRLVELSLAIRALCLSVFVLSDHSVATLFHFQMSLFPETLSASDFPSIFWTDSVPHIQDAWSLPTFISSLSDLTHVQSCQFHPCPNNPPTSDSSPDFYKGASTHLLDLSTWPTAQIERIPIGLCHPSLSLSSVNRTNVFLLFQPEI